MLFCLKQTQNISSERPLSKLSENHKINVIGPTELKLWPFKEPQKLYKTRHNYKWGQYNTRITLPTHLKQVHPLSEVVVRTIKLCREEGSH